jgi:hypothetical protein
VLIIYENLIEGDGVDWTHHSGVGKLLSEIDLVHSCGYITMVQVKSQNLDVASKQIPTKGKSKEDSLTLFLKPHEEIQALDTPATPSCVEAWIQTLSTGQYHSKESFGI